MFLSYDHLQVEIYTSEINMLIYIYIYFRLKMDVRPILFFPCIPVFKCNRFHSVRSLMPKQATLRKAGTSELFAIGFILHGSLLFTFSRSPCSAFLIPHSVSFPSLFIIFCWRWGPNPKIWYPWNLCAWRHIAKDNTLDNQNSCYVGPHVLCALNRPATVISMKQDHAIK
jgi:hypothetical protein